MSASGSTRRRLAPEARRAELLEAAIDVLARRPLDDVAVEDIAAAASASVGLLYHHFGSKEALAVAALDSAAQRMVEALDTATVGSPAEQLAAGLSAYLDFLGDHPRSWSALLRAGSTSVSGTYAAIARRVDDHAIDLALRALDVTDPVDVLRLALRGWVNGVKAVCLEHLEDGRGNRQQLEVLLTVAFEAALQGAALADPRAQPALDRFHG